MRQSSRKYYHSEKGREYRFRKSSENFDLEEWVEKTARGIEMIEIRVGQRRAYGHFASDEEWFGSLYYGDYLYLDWPRFETSVRGKRHDPNGTPRGWPRPKK